MRWWVRRVLLAGAIGPLASVGVAVVCALRQPALAKVRFGCRATLISKWNLFDRSPPLVDFGNGRPKSTDQVHEWAYAEWRGGGVHAFSSTSRMWRQSLSGPYDSGAGPRECLPDWTRLVTAKDEPTHPTPGLGLSTSDGVIASGWPWPALSAYLPNEDVLEAKKTTDQMISIGSSLPLPTRPIWRGLGLDALVYSAGTGSLLLVPAWAKKARRRLAGVCAECGYDRRGLAPDAKCPECGRA